MTDKSNNYIEGNDKPVFYSGTNSQVEVSNAIERYLAYAKANDDYFGYFAITLTIPDHIGKHIKSIGDNSKSVIGYFEFLLTQWGLKGVWTVEHTRKGVEHLHGVVYNLDIPKYNKQSLKIKGKWTYTYIAPMEVYPYHHIIKTLPSKRAMTGWRNYMIKHCIHKSVIEYFDASADESFDEC